MAPAKKNIVPLLIWLSAALISIAVAGAHFYFLHHAGGFWRDEVNLINLSGGQSWADMEKDSFPLLMPLLIRAWLGAGGTETGLRGLGLLIGLGILLALWLASWKITRRPPLLGLALFAANSTLIIFGDSLRAYGLGCLGIILATFAGGFFVLKPSWSRAGWLAAFAILSVQTLYHNAILVGAICLAAALAGLRHRNRAAVIGPLVAGALAAVSLLPYLPILVGDREASGSPRTGLKLPRLMEGFQDSFGFPVAQYIWVWGLLAAVVLFCGWRVFRESRSATLSSDETRSAGDLTLFAAATLALASIGFLVFLWLAAFPSQSWYWLPLMAVAVVCLDLAWPQWPERMHTAIVVLALGTVLIATPVAGRFLDYHYTNVDVWARALKNQAAPDDYIVVVPWFDGITFEHYFKNPTAWDTLPPISDHRTHRFDLVKIQLQNTNALAPVLERMTTALQSGHRVWVLAEQGWMGVPEPGTPAAAPLPPAPLGPWGWSEMPYTMVWVSQTAHYLGDHSREFVRVKSLAAGQRIIENTELFVADGWRADAHLLHPAPTSEPARP